MGLHRFTGMGLHRLAGMEVKFIHIVDLIGALNQCSLRIFGKGENQIIAFLKAGIKSVLISIRTFFCGIQKSKQKLFLLFFFLFLIEA